MKVLLNAFILLIIGTNVTFGKTLICEDSLFCPSGIGLISIKTKNKNISCIGSLLGNTRNYLLTSSDCLKNLRKHEIKQCEDYITVSFAKSYYNNEVKVPCDKIISIENNNIKLAIIKLESPVRRTPLKFNKSIFNNLNSNYIWYVKNYTDTSVVLSKKICSLSDNFWLRESIKTKVDGKLYLKECNVSNESNGAPITDEYNNIIALYKNEKMNKASLKKVSDKEYKLIHQSKNISYAQNMSCVNLVGVDVDKLIISSSCNEKDSLYTQIKKELASSLPKWLLEKTMQID